MTREDRLKIIETSWEIHSQVEHSYLNDTSKKGDALWLEKQRFLLADMAMHLLQTSMNTGEIDTEKLKNNLHAILTISDQFLPEAELMNAAKNLYG